MPSHTSKGSSRSGLSRQLVTSELLDASTRLFAEKGYESTTLQDIAKALGMSRPALYHYVSSKEELLGMLVEQVSQGFAEVLRQLTERADLSPTEKLDNVVEITVRQRAQHPDQFRILDQSEQVLPEPVRTHHRDAKRKVLREVITVIEDGIAAGEFRAVDPRSSALSLLGMCNWVAWWFPRSGAVEPVVESVSDLARAMLVAPARVTNQSATTKVVDEIRGLLDRLDPKSRHQC